MTDRAPLGSPYRSRATSPTQIDASPARTSESANANARTPSRMSRMFSFGAAPSATATNANYSDNDSRNVSTMRGGTTTESGHLQPDSSTSSTSSRQQPRTGRSNESQTGTNLAVSNNLEGSQRVRSGSSVLSSMVPGSTNTTKAATATTSASNGHPPHSSSLQDQNIRNANTSMIVEARSPQSTGSWRFPWTSAKKVLPPTEDNGTGPGPSAYDVGLTMYKDMVPDDGEDVSPASSHEQNEDVEAVLDEGVSMSDTSGKVDFMTSLPLELSLYVLLFADVPSLCQAMQVSTTWYTITSDALIWRDHFYRNQGWDLRSDYLENVRLGRENVLSERPTTKQFESQNPAVPRHQRSSTATSDGSIAARIGRRISDIVTDMGFLNLRTEQRHMDDGPADRQRSSAVGLRNADARPFNDPAPSFGFPYRAPTPSRTRSSTATSTAATHPSNFYTPLRTSMRQNSINSGSAPPESRRASQSFSVVQSLLESHGSPNIHGIPLGHQVTREIAANDGRHSPSPMTPTRPSANVDRQRLLGSEGVAMHEDVDAAVGLFEADRTLLLDWKGLYRDRYVLEQRWREGLFTTRIFKGHLDSVYCAALHDNLLISGSRDQTIKVWDLKQERLLRTIEAHSSSVLAIVVDGNTMVTGASNGELYVWDTTSWEVTDILEGHTAGVLDVQMDGDWIASCSKDSSIRVWKRDTKEAYRVLQGHHGPVNAIQIHDGIVCSASGDASAKLWSIETGKVIRVLKGHERGLACIQYDGTTLITGSNDRTIRIWDPNTGKCLRILKGHKDLVRTLSYDPIRNTLFSGSYDKTCRLWDLETGNPRMIFKSTHSSLIFDVTMDASRLASCSHDQTIVVTDFGEGLKAHRFI